MSKQSQKGAHLSGTMDLQSEVLHAYVALQHLGQGRPILEIANDVGLSRFAVSRMVKKARELGLVEVRATLRDPLDITLSAQLAAEFSLRSALVVAPSGFAEDAVRHALSSVTAKFLRDNVHDGDIIGITPGRTMVRTSRLVSQLPVVDVVQLTGVGNSRLDDGVEAVMNLAKASSGEAYPLYAPFLGDRQSTSTMLSHPSLQRTLQRFQWVDQAFLTIGGWPDASLLAKQVSAYGDDHLVKDVVAELGSTLLDGAGQYVDALEGRLIGISSAELHAIPQRVAIGGGAGKHSAVLAVLRSGLADIVITDVATAKYALERS